MNELWQVTAPHFCAGMTTSAGRIAGAAPILKWAVGWDIGDFLACARDKGWKVEYVGE